jgi:lipopolysaccharide transport system permease protein
VSGSVVPDRSRSVAPDAGIGDSRAGATGGRSKRSTMILPPGRGTGWGLDELWRFRSLAFVLARRSLKVRYRQTLLGIAWVLLQPLTLTLVFSVFFSLIARGEAYGIPYPVFFLCALAIWQPVIKIVNEGTVSIVGNVQLVTGVYMPRALIPISVALATVVDLVFELIALLLVLLFFGFVPTLTVLVVPFFVVVAYATAVGLAFVLSALNTTYRDVQVMLAFLVQLWFFTSPLLYPASVVPPDLQPFYYLNPLALVMEGSRWAFTGTAVPPDYAWFLGTGVAAMLLVLGYLFFHRRAPTFSDVL